MGCLQELDSLYLAAPGDSHPDDFTTRAFGTVAMNKEKWVGIPTLVAVGMFAIVPISLAIPMSRLPSRKLMAAN